MPKKTVHFIQLLLLSVFALLVFTRCATESSPQGGKQDSNPPEIKFSSPPNGSVFFTAKTIKIRFDEFIKASGFSRTLISPPLDEKPSFKLNGKTLFINLKSPLKPNTTYSINFSDDIKDNNEGNTLKNFVYVFSTGLFIDSLFTGGTVVDAKTGKPSEGVLVSLYNSDKKDGILSEKPAYFAFTDKEGKYQIKNIKQGDYYIYALKDQNFNYIYDLPNEQIAFFESILNINDTLTNKVDLYTFQESQRLKLLDCRIVDLGKIQICYSAPIKTLSIDSKFCRSDDLTYTYPSKDSIIYWYSNTYDTIALLILTANDTLKDTVRIDFKNFAIDQASFSKEFSLKTINQSIISTKQSGVGQESSNESLFKPIVLQSPQPIVEINRNKAVKITSDSIENLKTQLFFYLDSIKKQEIYFEFEKLEKTKYVLMVPDSTFKNIFGVWNNKFEYKFVTTAKENYGNIRLKIKIENIENYYILEIYNSTGIVVKRNFITGDRIRNIEIKNVDPGNYKLRVIQDKNHDGRWNTGSFKNKTQSEKIYNFSDTYTLKSGWDLEIDITL